MGFRGSGPLRFCFGDVGGLGKGVGWLFRNHSHASAASAPPSISCGSSRGALRLFGAFRGPSRPLGATASPIGASGPDLGRFEGFCGVLEGMGGVYFLANQRERGAALLRHDATEANEKLLTL
jgi:hypothetical protein